MGRRTADQQRATLVACAVRTIRRNAITRAQREPSILANVSRAMFIACRAVPNMMIRSTECYSALMDID